MYNVKNKRENIVLYFKFKFSKKAKIIPDYLDENEKKMHELRTSLHMKMCDDLKALDPK